jgi:hypothetical protein
MEVLLSSKAAQRLATKLTGALVLWLDRRTCDPDVRSFHAPEANQAFHPCGVDKLVAARFG